MEKVKQAVFVINSLQNGGAERVVATQADYLQEQGIQVIIICLRRRLEYMVNSGIKVICLTEKKEFERYSYFTKLFFLVRKLNMILDLIYKKGSVVLLTSHLLYPNLITRLSKYSKQSVYVLHSLQNIVSGSRCAIYKWFIRWLYRDRQIICISHAVKNEMKEIYGIDGDRIVTIHNPLNFHKIDVEMMNPLDFQYPYILYCGRLSKIKRPDRIIDAYYYGGFYKSYRLVMLGSGEYEENLRERVDKYGISEKVCFAGWERNVYRWMKRAKLLVLTSESEGLSMVLCEALYCECPVVSVNCYGPAEILTGELAYYLCDADIDSIVEKMKCALEKYPSELKKYAKEFAVDNNVDKYLTVYSGWNMSR